MAWTPWRVCPSSGEAQFNRREQREPKVKQVFGHPGAITWRVKTLSTPARFLAFFVLFVVSRQVFVDASGRGQSTQRRKEPRRNAENKNPLRSSAFLCASALNLPSLRCISSLHPPCLRA